MTMIAVILGGLLLILYGIVIPLCIGAGVAAFVEKQERNLCFIWIAGYLLYFSLFQLVSVPLILKAKPFSMLVSLFAVIALIVAGMGAGVWVFKMRRRAALHVVKPARERSAKILAGKTELCFWILAGIGLLIQLFLQARLAFGDGDDAYFVAVSHATITSNKMYLTLPYTGGSTILEIRHALAPFPIFISFVSRMSGLHTATVSHIVIPFLLLPLTYGIYGMIGSRLLTGRRKWLPLFLVFAELLVIWGNVSLYTAETFLITRTGQGKAALANLVIPALFLLLYMVGERIASGRRVEKSLWLLAFCIMMTACFCSTLGGFLIAVLLGVFGLCVVFVYRKWSIFLPLCLCLMPAAVYIGLYLLW